MIALRLHRRRRRPIEILDVDQAPAPPSAIAAVRSAQPQPALPSPRHLPRRPTWAGPEQVAKAIADTMRTIAKPRVSDNRVAAHLDRRLRRSPDAAAELDRIRRELAEVRHWLNYLPRWIDDEVHQDGEDYAEDYEVLRAIVARSVAQHGPWRDPEGAE